MLTLGWEKQKNIDLVKLGLILFAIILKLLQISGIFH